MVQGMYHLGFDMVLYKRESLIPMHLAIPLQVLFFRRPVSEMIVDLILPSAALHVRRIGEQFV